MKMIITTALIIAYLSGIFLCILNYIRDKEDICWSIFLIIILSIAFRILSFDF